MHQPASIFNDVIGPVMIGPSSSHTAASVRIGQVIRNMMGGQVRKAVFEFSAQGSLATTYQGQGSAFGLAAGILGLAPDDPRVVDALTMAKSAGVEIEFLITDEPCDHPNIYKATMWDDHGACLRAEMASVGGGMIEVRKIEDIPVLLGGGYYETIFLLGNLSAARAGKIYADAAALMASSGLSYDEISLHHNEKGDYLFNIKSSVPLPAKAGSLMISAGKRLDISPVLPVLSQKEYKGLFNTGEEMLAVAAAEHLSPWELAVKYECLRGGIPQRKF